MPSFSDRVRHLLVGGNTPPNSIKVVIVPADGSPLNFKSLHTVETNITLLVEPPVSPTDPAAKKITDAKQAHMIYYREESACQPDISFLPDTKRHRYWDEEAWNHRCVTGTAKFHVFFTRSKSGLRPNPHVGNRVGGDVFILKVSDTDEVDQYGNNFYVDMERDDLGPGVATDLLWELPIFRPAT